MESPLCLPRSVARFLPDAAKRVLVSEDWSNLFTELTNLDNCVTYYCFTQYCQDGSFSEIKFP